MEQIVVFENKKNVLDIIFLKKCELRKSWTSNLKNIYFGVTVYKQKCGLKMFDLGHNHKILWS